MKRVLIEASPMIDLNKSGVGYYVEGFIKSLSSTQNDSLSLTAYYFNFLGMNKEILPKVNKLRLHRIWLMPGKIISLCRKIGIQPYLEFFIRTKTDIIIFTNYVSLPLFNKKVKKVLIVYDMCFLDYPNYVQNKNLDYLTKFCPPSIKESSAIITISEFTKSRITHYFPDLKIPIIVTPIPPLKQSVSSTILPKRISELGVVSNKYILHIGTIEPRKNIQNLVKAYAMLDKKVRDNYTLVIAGGKGWKDEDIWNDINKYRKDGLRIITPGYVTDNEKRSLYSNATCFVLPSHYEGFGMPILEAMQYNIPSAISDIPVFKEVAGEAALFFNKDSIEDISEKIDQIISNSKVRNKLIREGAIQIKKFNWEDNSKKVINALEAIK